MKSMKKLVSALLTAAMVCSITFPAFATSTGTPTVPAASDSTAAIHVTTGNEGDTLEAYKVVNAKFDATTNDLEFEFSKTFTEFLASDMSAGYSKLTPEGYTDLNFPDDSDLKATTELRILLGAFSAYIKSGKYEVAAEERFESTTVGKDGAATFSDVPMGQYIILGAGNTNGAYIYQTVTAEVVPVANPDDGNYLIATDYYVAMKTSKPTAEKKVDTTTVTEDGDKHTASIGDSVGYELTASVPTYPIGATNNTFYMGDTLTEGLSWDLTKKMTVQGVTGEVYKDLEEGKDYTVTRDGQTLYIDFTYDGIKTYESISVKYHAIINENAKIGTIEGNENTYDLVYSNSPFDGNSYKPGEPDRPGPTEPGYGSVEDQETVYTYALLISKYEDGKPESKLAGAVFEVYTKYENSNWGGTLVGTITTDANGYAALEGLKAGTYHLKEVKAPSGYKLMTTDTAITISETANVSKAETTHTEIVYTTEINEALIKAQARNEAGELLYLAPGSEAGSEPTTEAQGNEPAYVKSYTTTVTEGTVGDGDTGANGFLVQDVPNVPGSSLPSTGGIGTTIFYVVGGILMLAAAIMFITKKRMDGRN